MFHVLELEKEWRIANGKVPGFGSLGACKPVVAVGAEQPLEDEELLADYFRGFIWACSSMYLCDEGSSMRDDANLGVTS